MACDPRQPRIDHRHDAFNRHRAFSDIGRKNHFTFRSRFDRSILLFGGQIAVQRRDEQIVFFSNRGASRLRPPDLRRSRQENQNITIEPFLEAACAWAEDTDFGARQDLSGASPWKKFAVFLYCGKIYE